MIPFTLLFSKAVCQISTCKIVMADSKLPNPIAKVDILRASTEQPIGFETRNRDGLGASWHQVHEVLGNINRVGWSDQKTKNAVCVEIPPGDTTKLETGSLTHSTLGCGHTNCGLRAVEAECSNNFPKTSETGKLNRENVAKTDKSVAEAVVRGLFWKISEHGK